MDVELLRPGTVPIAPDTVLWFEFLLDHNLLLKHLEKPKPDPSATDLIIKFLTSVLDSVKNDTRLVEGESGEAAENIDIKPRDTLKNLALKILALKVAAFLKWDLQILDEKLPLKLQKNLMEDLLYFTNNCTRVDIPIVPDCDIANISEHYLFALVLYYRWLLKAFTVAKKPLHFPVGVNGENNHFVTEEYLCTPELMSKTVTFLNDALDSNRTPKIITYDALVMLSENSNQVNHDWSKTESFSNFEFKAQLNYDLGCFYFHHEKYKMATTHFKQCSKNFDSLNKSSVKYIDFSEEKLVGFLNACGMIVDSVKPSLVEQMNTSVTNHYTGILSILQQDNVRREIPMVGRSVLELDIQGALSSGKFTVARDLLLQIQTRNIVRSVSDGGIYTIGDFVHHLELGGKKAIDMLFNTISTLVKDIDDEVVLKRLKVFLYELVLGEQVPDLFNSLLENNTINSLFTESEIQEIIELNQTNEDNLSVPPVALETNWSAPEFTSRRCPPLEVKALEQELISCYSSQKIRELLVKLAATNPVKPLWRVNPMWELALPLQSVVMSLPRGFLQDFSYVLLAKSRELMVARDYLPSRELLSILEVEVKNYTGASANVLSKLSRLISWEGLLVEVTELFDHWPALYLDRQSVALRCKQCLSALQNGDSVLPRLEVIEQCALCLLNLTEWDILTGMEKRWNYFEMAAAVAYACQDLMKYKGNKKVSRDMWDLVLPLFGSASSVQVKRSNTGSSAAIIHRDSPTNANRVNLVPFMLQIRDPTALNIVVSLLARVYNILRDEMNNELNVENIGLWPAVISNANSYNIRAVCETLLQVLTQALRYYPNNVSWLKLMGDVHFVNGNDESALNYYIQSVIVTTDAFSQPISKPLTDEHVIRRMIKSCVQLGCHTQAAVLCQFLDEVDYALAFKCLGDIKPSSCSDAMDAYYNCFWDSSILEYLVHLHHKRGEFFRKQQAIKVMGMLELNYNNNEEIQREATNIRKVRFFRALSKQFLE